MSASQDYAIIEYHVNLAPDALGNRRKTIDVAGSRVYVDTTRSDVYLDKVYIGVDEKGAVPVSLTRVIDVYPSMFSRINIEWTSENDYKTLVLIVTRASAKIQVPQPVDVMSIRGDIARESTLSSIRSQIEKLNFDSANRLRVSPANAEIMLPVDLQARYKPPGITLYSGTVTSSGNTAGIDVSLFSSIRIMVKVTSVSGTNPSLNVYVEGLYEATGDYVPLLSRTGITSTGVYELGQLDNLCFRFIRVRWTVSGTNPSFTFTVVAQALV